MAIEKERKFLVNESVLPKEFFTPGMGDIIEAGYYTQSGMAVRVTVRNHGRGAENRPKPPVYKVGFKTPGAFIRHEYEYHIPPEDALQLLRASPTYLQKERFYLEGWEVDCIDIKVGWGLKPSFTLKGKFWIAEYEEEEGKPPFEQIALADWVGKEVTEDRDYSNQAIAWACGKVDHGGIVSGR